tara:strand:- start:5 stop:184 length:180 start_codon:yes stop_codon:yes gene_type:complete
MVGDPGIEPDVRLREGVTVPATPCGLSPTLETKKLSKVEKIYALENPQSTKKAFDLYRG